MIRKLKSGQYRLYSRKNDAKTRRRKNLGTSSTRDAAEQHEREVQCFKRHCAASDDDAAANDKAAANKRRGWAGVGSLDESARKVMRAA